MGDYTCTPPTCPMLKFENRYLWPRNHIFLNNPKNNNLHFQLWYYSNDIGCAVGFFRHAVSKPHKVWCYVECSEKKKEKLGEN